MEVDFPSSPETSLEIPSIIEAISTSIDDARLNMDELERSTGEMSTTTDSDLIEYDDGWQSTPPADPYYQSYQQPSSVQWNYSPYTQYGYVTPSPYNSYYMQSPPAVDYHQNYMYSNNYEPQPNVFKAVSGQQDTQNSCSVCLRSFKSASNLTRHFMSKTHLKRLESRKQNQNVAVVRVKKSKVGSSFTDISKDERQFLWQLDDEIFKFLKEIEIERLKNGSNSNLALPTPPLSPTMKNPQIVKVDGQKTIPSSESEPFEESSPKFVSKSQNDAAAADQTPNSVASSPAVLINEKGERFEVIFSDENFGENLK